MFGLEFCNLFAGNLFRQLLHPQIERGKEVKPRTAGVAFAHARINRGNDILDKMGRHHLGRADIGAQFYRLPVGPVSLILGQIAVAHHQIKDNALAGFDGGKVVKGVQRPRRLGNAGQERSLRQLQFSG